MLKNLFLLVFLMLGCTFAAQAQELYLPLNDSYNKDIEKVGYSPEHHTHTAVKPWREAQLKELCDLDSLRQSRYWQRRYEQKWKNILWNSVFNTDLIALHGNNQHLMWGNEMLSQNQKTKQGIDFSITGNILMDFEIGRDFSNNRTIWVNTRGAEIKGNIGSKFAFYSAARENQAVFPAYVSDWILENKVIPGQGWYKAYGDNGFDYANSMAYLSYAPGSWINLTLGYGKNFIGDGYRSLFLSDNAFSYPYLKINAQVWHLQYTALYTQMIDRSTVTSQLLGYDRKYAAMHYLDWSATQRFNIALFDGVIWKDRDSTGVRGFDLQYLNPIVFLRPVEYTTGQSQDNAFMGLTASYKLWQHTVAYAQFFLDELKIKELLSSDGWYGNKQSYQIGIKSYQGFGIENLFLQTEFNIVRPYTYSHWGPGDNYAHFNQALAHPWGANFWESVTRVEYNYKRLYAQYKLIFGCYGADLDGLNYGQDIFQSYLTAPNEYGNTMCQGQKTNLLLNDFVISLLINPSYNLNVFVGYTQRKLSNDEKSDNAPIISMGLRTSLTRNYYDF